jgi:hypothetical protein
VRRAIAALSGAFLLLLAAKPAEAAQLRLTYPALERLLVLQVLTDGGRLYLEGGPGEECRYAFVQEPHVSAFGSRLRIDLLFSGRAGASVAGRCVGPGDTLRLEIHGVPVYADGVLGLDQLRVEAPESAYFRVVSGLVSRWMQERLRYPLRAAIEETLRGLSSLGAVRLQLGDLKVGSVVVSPDGLLLDVDFDVTAD